ncbi:hypothetical protein GCM10023205_25260 [Yinghuangia aomiensis]|uniref:Uncharacterized protein n=1 Tax=Yinghuangia aomiensis TaxID=676205 RepID=A0ABP9H389_9ACTN
MQVWEQNRAGRLAASLPRRRKVASQCSHCRLTQPVSSVCVFRKQAVEQYLRPDWEGGTEKAWVQRAQVSVTGMAQCDSRY